MLKNYQEVILKIKFFVVYWLKLIGLGLLAQIIIFLLVFPFFDVNINEYDVIVIKEWAKIALKNYFRYFANKELISFDNELLITAITNVFYQIKFPLFISFGGWIMPVLFHKIIRNSNIDNVKNRLISGSKILKIDEYLKEIKKFPSKLAIGGLCKNCFLTDSDKVFYKNDFKNEKLYRKYSLKVPFVAENRHFLVIGAPGSGKSVLLNQVIEQIKIREEKCIIHDFKGDMLVKHYDPFFDMIFNPLDQRCLRWTIFNDIENISDISIVASALFPKANKKEDPFWNNAARDIFEGILLYLYKNDLKTNKNIWEFVNKSPKEIKEILLTDELSAPAARYIDDETSKQTQGVMSKITEYTKCFRYLKNIDGNFSIKKWIKRYTGTIFLVNYADLKEVLSPAITLFIDIASKTTLSLPDNLNRRIFFIIDEFGQLNKISSLVEILTNGRSKGVSFWLAIQDIGQIEEIYGLSLKKTIVNSFSNYFIFTLNDPESAEFFSKKVGEAKFLHEDEMIHHSAKSDTEQLTIRKSQKTQKVLLPSDFMNLNEREAIFKLSVKNEWSKLKVYPKKYVLVTDRLQKIDI